MKHEQKLKQALQELDDLKSKIEGLMKPELKKGEWYRVKRGSAIQFNKSEGIGYGINEIGTWVDNCRWMTNGGHDKWQKATPQEVEESLIKEANRRYKIGDKVKDVNGVEIVPNGSYVFEYGVLYYGGATLMKKGRWAKAIQYDKFAELKEAHKNGAVIQYRYSNDEEWDNTYDNKPSWQEHCQYRIKPEEKPKVGDVVKAWDNESFGYTIGKVITIDSIGYFLQDDLWWDNAKTLTKKEAIDLLFNNK